ncbi:NlpC/P60 family protein [Nocardia sp. NPDC003693]
MTGAADVPEAEAGSRSPWSGAGSAAAPPRHAGAAEPAEYGGVVAEAPPAEDAGSEEVGIASVAPPPQEPGSSGQVVPALGARTVFPAGGPLGGLRGGNGSGSGLSNGVTAGAGSAGVATAPASAAPVGELTPQARAAVDALKMLRDAYGRGAGGTPGAVGPGGGAASGGGQGATAAGLAATQLYQRTLATAFHNLDNQLANYLIGLSGKNSIDRAALHRLLRDLDVALAEVGPTAYTAAGRERVHAILTAALRRGQQLTSGSQATAAETAAAIDQLTLQYLYNINGRDYPAALFAPVSGAGPVSAAGTSAAGQRALSVAMAQLGKPYVWGAQGPNAFDCSGLTQYAARSAGASIPRTSQEQYRQLPKVNPADIRPGDLIFPGERFNGGNPTHVLMYIGNGQCVEAPRTGLNVRVTKLPSSYAATRWMN